MGSNNFYTKTSSASFIVRNIAPQNKRLTVFGTPIEYGMTYDLLSIPEISEADIRESLLKGELANKIQKRQIQIVTSTIDVISSIKFQPGGLPSLGVVTTWADLIAVIDQSNVPLNIYFDSVSYSNGKYSIPAGTYNMKNSSIIGVNFGYPYNELDISNGVILQNIKEFRDNIKIDFQNNTVGVSQISNEQYGVVIFDNVRVTCSGTTNGILIPTTQLGFLIEFRNQAIFQQYASNTVKLIKVGAGAFATLRFLSSPGGTAWFQYIIEAADNTAMISFAHVGPIAAPTPGSWIISNGFTAANTLIEDPQGMAMTTANRNSIGSNISKSAGNWYYDTTVNKPVYWNGSAWVDSQNVSV